MRPASEERGCGRSSRRGCFTAVPLAESSPVRIARSIIAIPSEKTAREVSIEAPRPSNSSRPRPRPIPATKRPPQRWSSMLISAATLAGVCQGKTITAEPSWIRSVRAAR